MGMRMLLAGVEMEHDEQSKAGGEELGIRRANRRNKSVEGRGQLLTIYLNADDSSTLLALGPCLEI